MNPPKTAVVAITEKEDQVLVGKKILTDHFLSGAWHIPGGKLREGESAEQALIREIKEEAGIEIKPKRLLAKKLIPEARLETRWYLCSAKTDDLKPGGDLSKVKFIPKAQVVVFCDSKAISLWPSRVVEYFEKCTN